MRGTYSICLLVVTLLIATVTIGARCSQDVTQRTSSDRTNSGQVNTNSPGTAPTDDANSAQDRPIPKPEPVKLGIDNLIAEKWAPLKGKNVGLITNKTGNTSTGEFGPHLFHAAGSFTLKALYSPEHGLMGQRAAGVTSDQQEEFEGVPVYSLYGSARKPTKEMLAGIDALVFDIQDVGVRPYTYLSTMILSMEAAAENGIPFYVLDRPNPLSGTRVEGNVLPKDLISFVGQVPVPYLHGMTLGELAKMAKAKGWFKQSTKLALTVIPMTGWKRSMYWPETGLTWVGPSPNVPHFPNAVGLAMLGATGELGILSVGVGGDLPFLRLGSNLVTAAYMDSAARPAMPKPLTPVQENFTATTSAGTKTYNGIRIDLPQKLSTIGSLYEPQYRMLRSLLSNPTFRASFDQLPQSTHTMYEKVTGVHTIMSQLEQCSDVSALLAGWRKEAEDFRKARAPFLIY